MSSAKPAKLENFDFVFVDQSGSNGYEVLQQNRHKIRQQARHHTITQWRANRTKTLEIQLVNSADGTGDRPKPRLGKKGNLQNSKAARDVATELKHAKLVVNPPLAGYENLRAKYNFDIPWLSSLANNHVGRVAADDNPKIPFHRTGVLDWLAFRELSYLDLIPAYHAQSPLLQSVVECTMIKAEHVLTPAKKTNCKVFSSYAKALRGVQEALKDEKMLNKPETLCALQLLQIYELLDVGTPEPWHAHTLGVHKLIQLRGPDKFVTDLDKCLLCAQIQHIYHQAFMQNRDCFLEQPEWQKLLKSMASTKQPVRHPMLMSLWGSMVFIPRLFRLVEGYIQDPTNTLDRGAMILQLHVVKSKIAAWRAVYLKSNCESIFGPIFYKNLHSVAIANESIINRLIVSLRPSEPDAWPLEMETQELGAMAMTLRTKTVVGAGFFVGMIQRATRNEWEGVVLLASGSVDAARDVVETSIFMKWSGMMGRGGAYGRE